jgi:excisionase family DNA binding protein
MAVSHSQTEGISWPAAEISVPTTASSSADEAVSVAEAAQRLGVSRCRIYALVEQGQLDDVGDGQGGLRINLASIERRLVAAAPVGPPLSPSSAWAVLALASGDAAFRGHVAARLSDPDRSRARSRLSRHPLTELLPRLRARATLRRFAVAAKHLSEMLEDARLVLAGPTAARALGWPFA